MYKKGNLLLSVLLALAGIVILSGGYLIYVSKTNPGSVNVLYSCGQGSNCALGEFGKAISVNVNGKVVFPDGLTLSLNQINDSRCPSGAVCIWAGELSASFAATGGKFGAASAKIVIGTIRNKIVSSDGYAFSLIDATENSATIAASVSPVVSESSGIIGYVHMAPTCPVERVSPDLNCGEKPYAGAKVDIILKSNGALIKSLVSDAVGIFGANLEDGTYTITAGPKESGLLPNCIGKEATVTANKVTSVDISCDTGIR